MTVYQERSNLTGSPVILVRFVLGQKDAQERLSLTYPKLLCLELLDLMQDKITLADVNLSTQLNDLYSTADL